MKTHEPLTSQNNNADNRISRRDLLGCGISIAAVSALGAQGISALAGTVQPSAPDQTSKPNVLLMLADNLGYGVPSCYNGGILDIPTPRIDKLAVQGLRLTNFNVENQCSPSRAAS